MIVYIIKLTLRNSAKKNLGLLKTQRALGNQNNVTTSKYNLRETDLAVISMLSPVLRVSEDEVWLLISHMCSLSPDG